MKIHSQKNFICHRLQRFNKAAFVTNLTFSGVLDGVNSVTVMMGRDMEWTGGGGTGGTTLTWGTSTDGFVETAAEDTAECAGVPDGELTLRSP